MVTLTWSFVTRFLPNFIYGLLPSISGSSSNMGFYRRKIIKMVNKMAATNQFTSIRCCGLSNLVILIGFLPNFKYSLIPPNPGSRSNMSFVRQMITKMADKMVAAYHFASIRCCGHSNIVIFSSPEPKAQR